MQFKLDTTDDELNEIIKEVIKELLRPFIKKNDQAILQIMREEISKICKDSLEEMRLLKKITGED